MNDLESRLRQLGPVAPDVIGSLADELAHRADAADLLDVAYNAVDSPLGPLLVCATRAGIVRLALPAEDHDHVLEAVARFVSPRVLPSRERLDTARRQLDEYFAGRRRRFDVPVDLRLARGFRRQVREATAAIAYGSQATYRELATRVGRPRAVRATGSALGANPVPIVVPCHRVVRTDGSLGGYVGGLSAKQRLLDLERGAATT